MMKKNKLKGLFEVGQTQHQNFIENFSSRIAGVENHDMSQFDVEDERYEESGFSTPHIPRSPSIAQDESSKLQQFLSSGQVLNTLKELHPSELHLRSQSNDQRELNSSDLLRPSKPLRLSHDGMLKPRSSSENASPLLELVMNKESIQLNHHKQQQQRNELSMNSESHNVNLIQRNYQRTPSNSCNSMKMNPNSTMRGLMRFCSSNEDNGLDGIMTTQKRGDSSLEYAQTNNRTSQRLNALSSMDITKISRSNRFAEGTIDGNQLKNPTTNPQTGSMHRRNINDSTRLQGSKKSRQTQETSNKRQAAAAAAAVVQKKSSIPSFFGILMKMRNFAYRMASKIESKRLAILQRQKFEFLRDKATIDFVDGTSGMSHGFSNVLHSSNYLNIRSPREQRRPGAQKSSSNSSFLFGYSSSDLLFNPESRWKFVWDMLNLIVIIAFFFFFPLHAIYSVSFEDVFCLTPGYTIGLSMALVATLDVLFSLNTARFSKGNLMNSRTMIFFEYFQHDHGLVNSIAAIAMWIVVIESFSGRREDTFNGKFEYIFMGIFVWRIFSLKTIQDTISDRFYFTRTRRGILQLSQIFSNLFIVSHLFACAWLVLGKYGQNRAVLLGQMSCADLPTNISQSDFSGFGCPHAWNDIIRSGPTGKLAFYEEYLRAYYFTTVTMITVGYGDVTPVNPTEYLFSIFTMLIACGMFGYGLNSIGLILGEMNAHKKTCDSHIQAINGFMNQKHIPLDLQYQVREYLQYFFLTSNVEDVQMQQKAIQVLPDYISKALLFQANKIVLQISPIFKENFSEDVLVKSIGLIEQRKFRPGEMIVEQGCEDDSAICFVEKGSVELFNKSTSEESLKLLNRGQCFGEVSFFSGMQRSLSVKAVDFTTLLVIKRTPFIELIKNSPIDLERFSMIKDSINLNSKFEPIGVYCFCCKSTTHLIANCSFVHHTPDKQKIIKDYSKELNQSRDATLVTRRDSRYNSLACQNAIQDSSLNFIEDNLDWLVNEPWFNEILGKELSGILARGGDAAAVQNNLKSAYSLEQLSQYQAKAPIANIGSLQMLSMKAQAQAQASNNSAQHSFVNFLQQEISHLRRAHSSKSDDGGLKKGIQYSNSNNNNPTGSISIMEEEEFGSRDEGGGTGKALTFSNINNNNEQQNSNVRRRKQSTVQETELLSSYEGSVPAVSHVSSVKSPKSLQKQYQYSLSKQSSFAKGLTDQQQQQQSVNIQYAINSASESLARINSRNKTRQITYKTTTVMHQRKANRMHRKSITPSNYTNYQGSGDQKVHQDMLLRQLYDMIAAQPNESSVESVFENMRNFLVYMPHNNSTRVINAYSSFMRKKVGHLMFSTKKSEFFSIARNQSQFINKRKLSEHYSKKKYSSKVSFDLKDDFDLETKQRKEEKEQEQEQYEGEQE